MSEMILNILRWAARLAALGLACMYGLMMFGEFTSPHSGPPNHLIEWIGIALLTLICVGALLAWKWELAGALLSITSLVVFMIVVQIRLDIVILVAASPALLFLADWIGRHPIRLHRH